MGSNIIGWIVEAVGFGTVILYGTIGETLTEKAGNLNLGTPGIMVMGGAFGFIGCYLYEANTAHPVAAICILIALLSSFLMAMFGGLIYAFLTTTFHVNQNVVGLTLTIFGVGFGKFFGTYVTKASTAATGNVSTKAEFSYKVFSAKIPWLSTHTGWVGEVFFSYGFMFYLAIIIAIVATLFLMKTRAGLNLRAVGENPATADAAGINVTKYKYLATLIGSGITGLGGLYYVLDYNNGIWATEAGSAIEAIAWLSVALVIFVRWRPVHAIWGSILFGICYWAYQYVPIIFNIKLNTDLIMMLPYVVTIIVLIISSVRNNREKQAPASLGLSYFREDR
ncbi:MAG: ABC transporter permease [Eubacterium sp.]|nr:ABC transporter permease [Eubacterium sp.]